jgi:hypothetical protein
MVGTDPSTLRVDKGSVLDRIKLNCSMEIQTDWAKNAALKYERPD